MVWVWGLMMMVGVQATGADRIELSSSGRSRAVIVLSNDAILPERTAAQELQSHLERVTGGSFPIVSEPMPAADFTPIYVGPCETLSQAFPDLKIEDLGRDGICMRTSEKALFLAGGRPRGTLYAVTTFLEDVVGCRWWTSKESFIPTKPTLVIPALNTVYTPKLQSREAFYRDVFDPVFASRCKLNGHFENIPEAYGGHYNILGWCHTFFQLLPPDTYFSQHPDWYSEIDGKRVQDGQLCLTNQEMRKELVAKALEWIRKDPAAGIISISQNDWNGRCMCRNCLDLETQEESPAGPIIHFVNTVAEEIEKEFPDVWVETLAYSYTRHAPKHAKPRENVLVRLCSIECSFSQPLATGPQNESFKKDIQDWSSISHQLYIWDYVTNFRNYLLPHPNMRVLAPNVRFFVDHKAIGLFEQGDSGSSCGDFVALRAWVLSHLMWDPSRDEKALFSEFMTGYYGPASQSLNEAIDLFHDEVEASGIHLGCFMRDTSSWLSEETLVKATTLFDQAEDRVSKDPTLLDRVKRARISLDHAWLISAPDLMRRAQITGKAFQGPQDPAQMRESFIQAAESYDVGQYREGQPFSEHAEELKRLFRAPSPRPKGYESVPDTDLLDMQDNEFDLFGVPNWSESVSDPSASDGLAARMTTDHTQWAVQAHLPEILVGQGRWRVMAEIRCEVLSQTGDAFQVGIYDEEKETSVTAKVIPLSEVSDGAYHAVDLGTVEIGLDLHLWVSPVNNPNQVKSIWVDRIFLVRDRTK